MSSWDGLAIARGFRGSSPIEGRSNSESHWKSVLCPRVVIRTCNGDFRSLSRERTEEGRGNGRVISKRLTLGGNSIVRVHDLRDFTHDRHRTVDDTPYGGGAGMVMRPEPWGEALDALLDSGSESVPRLIVPTPSGMPFTQALARELAGEPWLAFACGRYEGIDERVLAHAAQRMPVTPVSLGDYVLNGGEVAVLAIIEAVARLLPGVIGNAESLVEESHEDGLLEYPVYTKPASWRGLGFTVHPAPIAR